MSKEPVLYFNRSTQQLEKEDIYGERWLRWLYETRPGKAMSERVLAHPLFSRIYGKTQDTRWSARKIERFIREFRIPMQEYEDGKFRSFNEFFIRRFKPGTRPFASDPGVLPAFSEARYFAFEKTGAGESFPIKGAMITADALLGDTERAKPFMGGPLLLARLCPTDYHRFHFPDDGTILEQARLAGPLHSVNPLALAFKPDILMTNERQVSILQTRNFGKLAYVEVGATCVGKIVQTHAADHPFGRGDEKGYFLFGGSTVVVMGEPGTWKPDDDLLEHTRNGRETWIKLGQGIARRAGNPS